MWVLFALVSPSICSNVTQIAVSAGHEFIVSTDDKYSEICDDKVIWVDYVRVSHLDYGDQIIDISFGARKIFPRSLLRGNSFTLMTVQPFIYPTISS